MKAMGNIGTRLPRTKAGMERRKVLKRILKKIRICACGCGKEMVPRWHWYQARFKIPRFLAGHHPRNLSPAVEKERRRKIGLASKKLWANKAHRKRREAVRLPALSIANKDPNRGKKISKTKREMFASGLQTPQGGYPVGEWVQTKKGGYLYCASPWEKERCKVLDADIQVLSYQRQPFSIPYKLDGEVYSYFPDFLVHHEDGSKTLEEVKGRVFDEAEWVAKKKAARRFCKKHGLQFVVLNSLFLVIHGVKKIA